MMRWKQLSNKYLIFSDFMDTNSTTIVFEYIKKEEKQL